MPTTPQVHYSLKNEIPFLPTKIILNKEGLKVPCFIRGKGSPNEFNTKTFPNWSLEEIQAHKDWLKESNKLKECDSIINIIKNTPYVMIDTDDSNSTEKIESLNISNTFNTHSTRGKGKHYYIKLENKQENFKKILKINGDEIDLITDYCFEKLDKECEKVDETFTMKSEELESLLNFKIPLKEEKRINKTVKPYKNNDPVRNDFLNRDDYISKELLIEIITNLDPNYFKGYDRWVQFVIGLKGQVRDTNSNMEYLSLLMDFCSKMSNFKPEYIRENHDFWCKLDNDTFHQGIKSGSFWYWLKECNSEKFLELKYKRNGKINYAIFNSLKKYEVQKKYFEDFICCIRGGKLYYKEYDLFKEEYTELSEETLNKTFRCLKTEILVKDKKGNETLSSVSFMDKWLNDPYRRVYENEEFLPPGGKECPSTWFNLYTGMAVDDIDIEIPSDEDAILEIINPILTHIYNLSGRNKENYEFLLKILSFNFNYPGKRTKTAIVLRSKQGTGKNTLLEYIAKLQGRQYYACSSDADVFLSRFANGFYGTLTAVFDEMEMGHKVENRLKELTTADEIFVEKKGVMLEKMNLTSQNWFLTNKDNCMMIDTHNRRNDVMDCYEGIIKDYEYFNNLYKAIEDDLVSKCFVHYLRNIINTPKDFNFEGNRPCGRAYKDMVDKNSPPFINFLQSLRHDNDELDGVYTAKSLFNKFNKFLSWGKYSYRLNFRTFKQQIKAFTLDKDDSNNNRRILKPFRIYEKGAIHYKIDMDLYNILMEEYDDIEKDDSIPLISAEELNKYNIIEESEDEYSDNE